MSVSEKTNRFRVFTTFNSYHVLLYYTYSFIMYLQFEDEKHIKNSL